MTCPHCTSKTKPTFEGPQRWCPGCGTLTWHNPDGTVRHVDIPKLQMPFPAEPPVFMPESRGVHQ